MANTTALDKNAYQSDDAAPTRRRGAPRRQEVDRIRAKLWAHVVCLAAGITHTGYAMDLHFGWLSTDENTGAVTRRCQGNRYLHGRVPHAATIANIEARYPGCRRWLTLPLWDALRLHITQDDYWPQFFRSLRPSLVRRLFYARTDAANYVRKPFHPSLLEALLREGDEDALACLIGLLRERPPQAHQLHFEQLERVTSLLFRCLSATFPFWLVAHDIYAYLHKHIIAHDAERYFDYSWNFSHEDLERFRRQLHRLTLMAEDLCLINADIQDREFAYWLFEGDTSLIVDELKQSKKAGAVVVSNRDHGLAWLIGKLNKSEPRRLRTTR